MLGRQRSTSDPITSRTPCDRGIGGHHRDVPVCRNCGDANACPALFPTPPCRPKTFPPPGREWQPSSPGRRGCQSPKSQRTGRGEAEEDFTGELWQGLGGLSAGRLFSRGIHGIRVPAQNQVMGISDFPPLHWRNERSNAPAQRAMACSRASVANSPKLIGPPPVSHSPTFPQSWPQPPPRRIHRRGWRSGAPDMLACRAFRGRGPRPFPANVTSRIGGVSRLWGFTGDLGD
jgi:hypothetical protein